MDNFFFEFSFFTILLPLLIYLSHYLMISCDSLSCHFFVLDFTCVSNVYPSRRIHSALEHHKEKNASYHDIYHTGSAPFRVTIKCIYADILRT